ncbi:MAG: preprotein translocase subunit SecY [Candidatus Liptonbacteria bacterium]|nr:preprotein translocase subunit SecY [Candidatus Liptonbacteria bacterium]
MDRFLYLFRSPDLRRKILMVGGLLIAFRLLAAVPIPGVDVQRLQELFSSNQLLGFLNFFSGGGLSNLSLVMLGVGPYITATIIMQLLTIIFPKFKAMYYEEGARGQAKFNQYSRILTVPLAILQGYGFLALLARENVVVQATPFDAIRNVIIVTAGTMLTLWLGELISEEKIGNGISLIIFAGIVGQIPAYAASAISLYTPSKLTTYVILLAILLLLIASVVMLNEGERRIPIAYARRVRGMKMYGGASSYLPLKVNQAGMIPLIFAISVLLFPQFIAQIIAAISPGAGAAVNGWVASFLNNHLAYGVFYFLLVVMFTYFYTAITFNPGEVAKNLQRSGGFVTGIRPGEATETYFSRLSSKITLFGAIFLGLVAVLPLLVQWATGLEGLTISGTALLIVVAVALETMRQVNSQLTMREYEGM